jgi:hypothetical protein
MECEELLECGVSWRNTADPEAGRDLIRGLQSTDPGMRSVAQVLLVENGQRSMRLLENAPAAGFLSPCMAVQCIAENSARTNQARAQANNDIDSN